MTEADDPIDSAWEAILPASQPRVETPGPIVMPTARLRFGQHRFWSMGYHDRKEWVNLLPSRFAHHPGWYIQGFIGEGRLSERVFWSRVETWVRRDDDDEFRIAEFTWTPEELEAQLDLAIANKREGMR